MKHGREFAGRGSMCCLLLGVLFIFFAFEVPGRSNTVLSLTETASFGARSVFNQAKFTFGPGSPPENSQFLFDEILFTPQDVGHVFTISSDADDPDFDFVAGALTNGQDDWFGHMLTASNGIGSYTESQESQIFSGLNQEGPDLKGYHIDSFSLHVDSLSITSVGGWTDMNGSVTLSIQATPVPEPTTMLMLISGAMATLVPRSRFLRKLIWRPFCFPRKGH